MRRLLKYVAFCLCLLPMMGQAKLFGAEEFYLDNGLRVIVIPNHKAPIAKLMVWYKVGSVDEKIGQGGLAHLLEHLMFRGTKNVPDSAFNDIISRNGGESNAFTTRDFTAYHEFVDVSRLETALALEADRMVNLSLKPEAVERERDIVLDERRQRVMMKPSARFAEDLTRMLWQNHGYARPVSGTEQEITALNLDDVMAFYKRYYLPQNAVVVLSGDVSTDEAKLLVEKYFGKIKTDNILPPTNDAYISEYKKAMRMTSAIENVATPRIVKHYIVPSVSQNSTTAYALMLFAAYLSEGDNSYFNQNLVLTEKVTGAGASCDVLNRAAGTFSVSAIPYPGQSMEETEIVLSNALSEALHSIDAEDLEKLKKKQSANLVYVLDNPSDAAFIAGQMAALGLSLQDIENYEQNINAVTLGDIQSAVSSMLENADNITGILLPPDNRPRKEKL